MRLRRQATGAQIVHELLLGGRPRARTPDPPDLDRLAASRPELRAPPRTFTELALVVRALAAECWDAEGGIDSSFLCDVYKRWLEAHRAVCLALCAGVYMLCACSENNRLALRADVLTFVL